MRSLPKPDRSFAWVEIRREVRQFDLEITTPDANSYDVTLEEARLYLVQLGVPTLRAEKSLDKVWNFYAIRLHLDGEEYRVETLEPPQYPEYSGTRPLDDYTWVIESGRVK